LSRTPASTAPSVSISEYAYSPFDLFSSSAMFSEAPASSVEIWPTMLGTLLLAMQMREVLGARGSTISGKFTLFLMLPFSR